MRNTERRVSGQVSPAGHPPTSIPICRPVDEGASTVIPVARECADACSSLGAPERAAHGSGGWLRRSVEQIDVTQIGHSLQGRQCLTRDLGPAQVQVGQLRE